MQVSKNLKYYRLYVQRYNASNSRTAANNGDENFEKNKNQCFINGWARATEAKNTESMRSLAANKGQMTPRLKDPRNFKKETFRNSLHEVPKTPPTSQ